MNLNVYTLFLYDDWVHEVLPIFILLSAKSATCNTISFFVKLTNHASCFSKCQTASISSNCTSVHSSKRFFTDLVVQCSCVVQKNIASLCGTIWCNLSLQWEMYESPKFGLIHSTPSFDDFVFSIICDKTRYCDT